MLQTIPIITTISSIESQKGAMTIQQHSLDNQKDYGDSALLVLNETLLNGYSGSQPKLE